MKDSILGFRGAVHSLLHSYFYCSILKKKKVDDDVSATDSILGDDLNLNILNNKESESENMDSESSSALQASGTDTVFGDDIDFDLLSNSEVTTDTYTK
ncbi:hypothetical protein PQ460_16160 [Paenibacillus sp. KACC 21273]|uniref:hypothetical protein n=1 Tax=Paenibacillus sp. KACC 21273 TaxID=3025665 RepID=UPI0023667635|nr:hypothetical protein [Paenibacillus sp. KACC 21273]WDF49534.1 hypothetical protein PQ460_16160 [Paenibacillus sp. KACC 21273]